MSGPDPVRFGLVGYGLFGAHHAAAIEAAPSADRRERFLRLNPRLWGVAACTAPESIRSPDPKQVRVANGSHY